MIKYRSKTGFALILLCFVLCGVDVVRASDLQDTRFASYGARCLFAERIGISGISKNSSAGYIKYFLTGSHAERNLRISYLVKIGSRSLYFYDFIVDYERNIYNFTVDNTAIIENKKGYFIYKSPPLGGIYVQNLVHKSINYLLTRGKLVKKKRNYNNHMDCESVF